jgi:hypothetical protein
MNRAIIAPSNGGFKKNSGMHFLGDINGAAHESEGHAAGEIVT